MASTSYTEKELEFTIGEITLSGTLVLPEKQPATCVIMLSGYGSHARDNLLKELNRYKTLAAELAKVGIASYRFDDRGSGKSTQVNWHDYTFDDLADEANAAFAMIKTHTSILPEKIGFFGHSLGATIGPLASLKNNEVAFIVSTAPHAFIGIDTALETRTAIAKEMGEPKDVLAERKAELRPILEKLKDAQKAPEAITELQQIMMNRFKKTTGKDEINETDYTNYLKTTFEGFLFALGNTPMYRSFLTFNPLGMYKQLKKQAMFVFAGKDTLHPPSIHKVALDFALDAKNHFILDFPDANHDFTIIDKNKKTQFVPHFYELIVNWILEKTA